MPRQIVILTWNPDRWAWPPEEYAQAVQVTAAGGIWSMQWSLGVRKSGDGSGRSAPYGLIEWDSIVEVEDLLPTETHPVTNGALGEGESAEIRSADVGF